MKIKKLLIVLIIVVVILIFAVTVYISMNPGDTTLDFLVRDSVSKNWVWDSTITFQNRIIRGYFQSDSGPVNYSFTHLQPGEYQLEIKAPSYESVSIPITIKKGENIVKKPIDLIAYEIPNLNNFIIFENYEGNDIVQDIRPVEPNGIAILNHPCMNLQIASIVSVEMKGGLPVKEKTESKSERGGVLFKGKIDWSWDPMPETIFRYSSRIPGSKIKACSVPFLVIDYLILIPDPRKITDRELKEILIQTLQLESLDELQLFLEINAKDRFHYYFVTSWNVPGEKT